MIKTTQYTTVRVYDGWQLGKVVVKFEDQFGQDEYYIKMVKIGHGAFDTLMNKCNTSNDCIELAKKEVIKGVDSYFCTLNYWE